MLQAQGLGPVPGMVFHFLGDKNFCIVEKYVFFEFIDVRAGQLPIASVADVGIGVFTPLNTAIE